MSLPSNDHLELRDWLGACGVSADELAGYLLIDASNALLATAGSHMRLGPAQHRLLARGRTEHDAAFDAPPAPAADQTEYDVTRLLATVCAALGTVGVEAIPFEGMGVVFGGEVLSGTVQVTNPAGLYRAMNRSEQSR